MKNEIKGIILFCLIVGAYVLGFMARGLSYKQEVKEETIKRIAYALQSGMLTVNHDKIVEIAKLNKNVYERINTNGSDNIDSNIICSTNNENTVKLPEEG